MFRIASLIYFSDSNAHFGLVESFRKTHSLTVAPRYCVSFEYPSFKQYYVPSCFMIYIYNDAIGPKHLPHTLIHIHNIHNRMASLLNDTTHWRLLNKM